MDRGRIPKIGTSNKRLIQSIQNLRGAQKTENWQPSFKIQLKHSVNGRKMPNSSRDNCNVSKSSLQPSKSQKSIFQMFQRYTKMTTLHNYRLKCRNVGGPDRRRLALLGNRKCRHHNRKYRLLKTTPPRKRKLQPEAARKRTEGCVV
ncbi:hypothetical protein GH733_019295 [Mirounga leonina]|nr:hypothetical protein GH733_019295 [Mirounga leonina]